MEQIVIRVHDKEKAKLLTTLLQSLDFVDIVEVDEHARATDTEGADFFAMAGLWEGRDITLESLRQRAWPRQTS